MKTCIDCGSYKVCNYIGLKCNSCYRTTCVNKCINCNIEKVCVFKGPKCTNCYVKERKEKCYMCNNLKIICVRNKYNGPICNTCNKQINKEKCCICKKLCRTNHRDESNLSWCSTCYSNSRKEKCCICKNIRCVQTRNKNGPVCKSCNKALKRGYLPEEIILKKKLHITIFESMFPNFEKEVSISKLNKSGVFKKGNIYENILLRYDYYYPKNNILVEINEQAHRNLADRKSVV